MIIPMFLTCILIILILILALVPIVTNDNFNKLIKSDRYKNSNYLIHKYHNYYVLLNKTTGKYVRIDKPESTEYSCFDSSFVRGSKSSVMEAFNKLVPVIY